MGMAAATLVVEHAAAPLVVEQAAAPLVGEQAAAPLVGEQAAAVVVLEQTTIRTSLVWVNQLVQWRRAMSTHSLPSAVAPTADSTL
jgi:hypothetical protein